MREVTILDYGAGNVCSLRNAVHKLGYTTKPVTVPADIAQAELLIFPGVGAFGPAMEVLEARGYAEPLREYIQADRPFLGICIGFQALFESSEEAPGVAGLGIIKGPVVRFDEPGVAVPHMGWNQLRPVGRGSALLDAISPGGHLYFVHSYCVKPAVPGCPPARPELRRAGGQRGVAADRDGLRAGQLCLCGPAGPSVRHTVPSREIWRARTQFHPRLPRGRRAGAPPDGRVGPRAHSAGQARDCVPGRAIERGRRFGGDQGRSIRCQGAVEHRPIGATRRGSRPSIGQQVRNLGKPVGLAQDYYEQGADEISFLNITSFRQNVLADLPMLDLLRTASQGIFVPLTIGGGIRDTEHFTALQVADAYFRAGADKATPPPLPGMSSGRCRLGRTRCTRRLPITQRASGQLVGAALKLSLANMADKLL